MFAKQGPARTKIAAALLGLAATALSVPMSAKAAVEVGGFELFGYVRGGFFSANPSEAPKGGYTLGGDVHRYRLGNEGDNGIEFGIAKHFDAGKGLKWSAYYMPTVWNGNNGTAQAYATMQGLDFAPEVVFWAGQRRQRLQDVHIADKFFADLGDNYGAGFTNMKIGSAKLGVSLYTSGSVDNKNTNFNNARRLSFDLSEIPTNPGGTLRVSGSVVNGDFRLGSDGASLSLVHNQNDFLVKGLKNSLFVQTSTGHADLSGKFYNLSAGGIDLPGAKALRIVESINWQIGRFGGQAMAAYQTSKDDGGANHGRNTKDFSLGGRISYGVTNNLKMLAEVATTSRKIDGQATQRLSKVTVGPALALSPDFWSRPELRLYVQQANWNDAAAAANSATFGAGGRTKATVVGAQIEVWW